MWYKFWSLPLSEFSSKGDIVPVSIRLATVVAFLDSATLFNLSCWSLCSYILSESAKSPERPKPSPITE